MLTCNICNAQIKLLSNGYVGIGTTTPAYPVEIHVNQTKFSFINNGTNDAPSIYLDRYMADCRFYPATNHKGLLGTYNNFWYYIYADKLWYILPPALYSDIRLKKNVTPLQNSLDKILKLNGVEYDLNLTEFGIPEDISEENPMKKKQFGLIAQEVLEVIPEIVEQDSIGYAINYTSLIPVLIEAIKSQQLKIEELEKQLISGTGKPKNAETSDIEINEPAFLGKNHPNPFNQNTTIEYFLPSGIEKATLYIYDMQGKQLKSIPITGRENGQVVIHGSELQAGMYNYCLIADGQVVGTEQMILTD